MYEDLKNMSIDDKITFSEITEDKALNEQLLEEVNYSKEQFEQFEKNIDELYDPTQYNMIMNSFDSIIALYGFKEVINSFKNIKEYNAETSNLNIKNTIELIYNNENLSENDKEKVLSNLEVVVNALNKTLEQENLDESKFDNVMAKAESIINGLNTDYNLTIDFKELVKSSKNLDMNVFKEDLETSLNSLNRNSFEV